MATDPTDPTDVTAGPPGPEPAGKKARPLWRWTRRLLKLALWLVVFVVLLVGAVVVFLQTDFGKSFVKDTVLDLVNDGIAGRIEVDRLGGSLLDEVELHGVRVFSPDGTEILTVDYARADTHLLDLLDTTVRLSNIRVRDVTARMFGKDGRVLLAEAFAPATPSVDDTPFPWTLVFEDVKIEDALIENIGMEDVRLTDITVDTSLRMVSSDLFIEHLEILAHAEGDPRLPRDLRVTTRGKLAAQVLTLDRFVIEAGPHRVVGTASAELATMDAAEVHLQSIEIHLDALPPDLIALDLPAGGVVEGTAELSKAGDVLLADIALASPLGAYAVEGVVDLAGDAPVYEGRVDFAGARPALLVPELPTAALFDGEIYFGGSGSPLDPGAALHAEGSLEQRTPHPSGAFTFQLTRGDDGPEAAEPRFPFQFQAHDVELAIWAPYFGLAGMAPRVAYLAGTGSVVVPPDAPPRVTASIELESSATGHLVLTDESVDVPRLFGTVTADWDGEGLPTGTAELHLSNAVVGAREADAVDVDLHMTKQVDGTGYNLRGRLRAEGVVVPDVPFSAATLNVPVDVDFDDFESFPVGRVDVTGTGIRALGNRADRVAGNFRLTPATRGANLTGKLSADGLFLADAGARAGHVEGDVSGWVGFKGEFDGRVDVRATNVRVADLRLGTAHIDASVNARQGFDRSPLFQGTWEIGRLTMPDVAVERGAGTFDMTLDRGQPAGALAGKLHGVDAPGGRRFEVVDARADLARDGTVDYTASARQQGLVHDATGSATLPFGGRRLSVHLDLLTSRRLDPETGLPMPGPPLLTAEDIDFTPGGDLRIGSLRLEDQESGLDKLVTTGRVDFAAGSLAFEMKATDMRIATWLKHMRELLGADLMAQLPPLDGVVDFELIASGTLADPRVQLRLGLRDGRVDDLTGMTALVVGRVDADTIEGRAALSWHEGGQLDVRASLPARLSLDPVSLAWDESRDLDVTASGKESDLTVLQAWLSGLGAEPDKLKGEEVGGSASFSLRIEGPVTKPFMAAEVTATDLTLGQWQGGHMAVGFTSHDRGSQLTASLVDATEKPLIAARILLPFEVFELLGASDPLELARARLEGEGLLVDLEIQPIQLSQTPLQPFVSRALGALEIYADFEAAGKLSELSVEGELRVHGLEVLGGDSGAYVWLSSAGGPIVGRASLSASGQVVLDGTFQVPEPATFMLARDPLAALLADPALRVEVSTQQLLVLDLWDIDPTAGELGTLFFPDGRWSASLVATGGEAGPVADATVKLHVPFGSRTDRSIDRNLADFLIAHVSLEQTETRVALRMTQRGEAHTNPIFGVNASVGLGVQQLLAGAIGDPLGLPVEGLILADDFELEGLAGGLQEVLGPSTGVMRGRVELSGTVGDPQMVGSLEAWFQELSIAALGLHRSEQNVVLLFEGERIALVPIRFEEEPSGEDDGHPEERATEDERAAAETTDEATITKDESKAPSGDEAEEAAKDATLPDPETPAVEGEAAAVPFFEIAGSATIERLEPSAIALEASVVIERFLLFDRKDAKARLDGRIDVTGTAAAPSIAGRIEVLEAKVTPELGGRTVRSIGLPSDVTLVTGTPEPPAQVDVTHPFATNMQLDIVAVVPEDSTVVINSLLEVYPHGELRVATIGGRIGILGTIYVPRKEVNLYGKKFVLAPESKLVFTGDMTTDPRISMRAYYDISEVDLSPIGLETNRDSRITVAITGSLDNIRLSLSSDPAMDEANIISVVVVGTPTGPGASQETAFRTQVVNLVVGVATGGLTRLLTDKLPIDTFSIDTESGDLAQSRLTIGKRITKEILIVYRRNLGAQTGSDESLNEISFEYRPGIVTIVGNLGVETGEYSLEAMLRFRD